MKKIKLLLVDDQQLIRESLHILLDMDVEIEVVGVAENGQIAVELCEKLSPTIVLMDIHMPVMDGVEATKQIKLRWPNIHVIILTTFQEIQYVVEALSAGAEGYLLKAIHPKDLAAGIHWVSQGGTLIPQDIAKLLVSQLKLAGIASGAQGNFVNIGTEQQAADTKTSKLSKGEAYDLNVRELQVLHYVSEGLNNREIAEKLFLSEGTIKNYISIIYSKLNVHDRIKASKKALDEGMI